MLITFLIAPISGLNLIELRFGLSKFIQRHHDIIVIQSHEKNDDHLGDKDPQRDDEHLALGPLHLVVLNL